MDSHEHDSEFQSPPSGLCATLFFTMDRKLMISFFFLFRIEPPDIRNWFPSYNYESPEPSGTPLSTKSHEEDTEHEDLSEKIPSPRVDGFMIPQFLLVPEVIDLYPRVTHLY